MKTRLLKAMPHVALQKLRPELQEQNTQHDEEFNAVGGQENDEVPVNVIQGSDEEPNVVNSQDIDEAPIREH